MRVSIRIVSMKRSEVILMSTHKVHFHDKIRPKMQLNICFLELAEEFPWDKVNKLSVFQSLMFYCIFMMITGEFRTKQTRSKQDCLFNGSLPERLRGIPCVLQYWKIHIMTLTMLWANWADDKLMLFLVFFLKIRIWHFMQMVSLGENLHGVSNSFFLESKKNISKCRLLKLVPSMQSDN